MEELNKGLSLKVQDHKGRLWIVKKVRKDKYLWTSEAAQTLRSEDLTRLNLLWAIQYVQTRI